jgi:hypothetical protein
LGWGAVVGVNGYDLKRSTTPGGPYTPIASLYDTTYTDDSVVNGVTYYYVVASINAFGDGTNSLAISVTPSLDVSLTTWFKADAITGLVNGSRVSVWPDVSGNGDDAGQTNLTRQPVYLANAINGLPVIRFTAANSNELEFIRPVSDDFTIFCVFRSTHGYGAGSYYYQGAGLVSGEVSGVAADFGTCLFANGQVSAGTGNPDVATESAAGFNNGLPHVMTFKRIASTGEVDLYLDGQLAGSVTGSTASLTACARLVLGAQQTMINYLDGDIAEVKIYGSALSDYNRGVEEGGLACKYGIPGVGTPPAPPGGLTGISGNRAISLSWMGVSGATTYAVSSTTNLSQPFHLLVSGLTNSVYLDTNAVSGCINYYQVTAANGCDVSANSATLGVLLVNPVLSVANVSGAGGRLVIAWPAWADDWQLVSATNLVPPVVWLPVTNQATINNEQSTVTLPLDAAARFFRLSAP